ncbi:MAG: NAD(P)H-dependent glycerol-3-phosphate dehydrogenase [Dissulfuribacterales bacterium]
MQKVSVIGAGSWGTALAISLARKGVDCVLWARTHDAALELQERRENFRYLPGFPFPDGLRITSSLQDAVCASDVLLMVVPSHGMRDVLKSVAVILHESDRTGFIEAVISASKGIENTTLLTMTQVMDQVLPASLHGSLAVLSGPSFAREVAQGLPTAVTIAACSAELASDLQRLFSTDNMRAYASTDLMGVQLAGALKNVIAIAAGICDGMGLGDNARAALITRGLAEIARLGVKLGARPMTFAGLAGLGDLVLTCTGALSRNRHVGFELGKGLKLKDIIANMNMVAEGVKTCASAWDLAQLHQVSMPITEQVYRVLYEDRDSRCAVRELLARPLAQEFDVHLSEQ